MSHPPTHHLFHGDNVGEYVTTLGRGIEHLVDQLHRVSRPVSGLSPERAAKRPRYAYVPFGGGQRICIGQQFAMMEATLALATLAQRFTFRAVEGHPVEPHPQVTLRPKHGVAMRLSRRTAVEGPIPPGPRERPGESAARS